MIRSGTVGSRSPKPRPTEERPKHSRAVRLVLEGPDGTRHEYVLKLGDQLCISLGVPVYQWGSQQGNKPVVAPTAWLHVREIW